MFDSIKLYWQITDEYNGYNKYKYIQQNFSIVSKILLIIIKKIICQYAFLNLHFLLSYYMILTSQNLRTKYVQLRFEFFICGGAICDKYKYSDFDSYIYLIKDLNLNGTL
jgi:hypothetical protein